MSRRRSSSSAAGFTLVEALVATAVFALVVVGVIEVYASNSSVFNRSLSSSEALQNARVGIDLMSREIRTAGFDLSGVLDGLPQSSPIQTAELGRLTFVADLDMDGTLEQVTYRRSGGELIRESSSWDGTGFPTPVASVVADGLTQLRFSYLDNNLPVNNPLVPPVTGASLDSIHRIQIGVWTSARTGREEKTFPLESYVTLRN